MPRQSADGQSGRTNFQPVGGASSRSSRCGALFLALPSASTFPTADGQGGALTFQPAVPHPLASAEKSLNGLAPSDISHDLVTE
jgi:hypothetical protein